MHSRSRGVFGDAAGVEVGVVPHHTGGAVGVRIDDHPELGAGGPRIEVQRVGFAGLATALNPRRRR